MQGLGDLSDQLSIVNIKLFMVQECLHNGTYKEMEHQELEDMLTRNVALNKQRNQLIDEINTLSGTGTLKLKTG